MVSGRYRDATVLAFFAKLEEIPYPKPWLSVVASR